MTGRVVRTRHAPPRAGAMLEALRGLGYSTAAALADLIDNSISARSLTVNVLFTWQGKFSSIRIIDDGDGMNAGELDQAMRLGDRSPLETRESHDLGRFGLGLKTASFSQCRRLTVASRKGGEVNCLRWDLDVLAESRDDGWYLLEGPAEGSLELLQPLDSLEHGTLILWESLDRIITPGFGEQDLLDLIDRVEQHLAMTFHRYLEGKSPRLRILINGRPVVPCNPFLPDHPFTWSSPVERFQTDAGKVGVQCYVLPHRDRLDQLDYERAAGPNGWTAQQGFYIYRNERLLVAGSWLGLGQGRPWTKEEAHRLARIRLDIPNSADAAWKIDIRKSTARLPVTLRARLMRLAEDTRWRARRVFAHRGQMIQTRRQQPVAQVWMAEHGSSGIHYRIDRGHPVVRAVIEESGSLLPQVQAMLRVIEETVPVQRIWLDTTEGREVPRTGFPAEAQSDIMMILQVMYRNLVLRKGFSPGLAREQLSHTEPFHNYPDLVSGLPDDLETE